MNRGFFTVSVNLFTMCNNPVTFVTMYDRRDVDPPSSEDKGKPIPFVYSVCVRRMSTILKWWR